MFDFAEKTNDMSAIEILNYYRNLYYAEPQVTERGIVANAINDILNLIKRQKAENDKLNGELISALSELSLIRTSLNTAKSEAYKEFAEKLKEEMRLNDDCDYNCRECYYACNDYVIAIDNLLKEMVGEE